MQEVSHRIWVLYSIQFTCFHFVFQNVVSSFVVVVQLVGNFQIAGVL